MAIDHRFRFRVRWTAACAAAELVGIGAAAAVAVTLQQVMGEPRTALQRWAVLAALAGAGAIEGGALGWLQWRLLRQRLPRLRRGEWVGITLAVAVVGWVAGMAGPLFGTRSAGGPEPGAALVTALAAALGAGAGACFGAAQWLVLRNHAQRSARWIAIQVPGWAAAMAATFLGASLPEAGWAPAAIVAAGLGGGLAGGLLLGAITGGVAWDLQPWVDERHWSLRGKVCVLTGATSGIRHELARGLARMGATLVLLVRDPRRGERARAAIAAESPGASVQILPCDLTSLRSVGEAAEAIRARFMRVHLLVNAAGATFPGRTLTEDGVERTLAVDLVGPFALAAHLLDRLEGGRVITLAGIYQRRAEVVLDDLGFARRPYHWLAASNQAQRGRVLFTAELARRAPKITAVAVHPGAVLTAAQGHLPWLVRLLLRTVMRPGFVRAELGALPVLRLAAQPHLEGVSGRFFDRFRLAPDLPDPALAGQFWDVCEELAGLGQLGQQAGAVARGNP